MSNVVPSRQGKVASDTHTDKKTRQSEASKRTECNMIQEASDKLTGPGRSSWMK
jgi:hypothetical protein